MAFLIPYIWIPFCVMLMAYFVYVGYKAILISLDQVVNKRTKQLQNTDPLKSTMQDVESEQTPNPIEKHSKTETDIRSFEKEKFLGNTYKEMQFDSDIVVGLDLGSTKIICAVAKRDQFNKLKIIGVGKVPFFGITSMGVSNIKHTTDAIKEAVAMAEKESKHNITSVFVNIGGQHIDSKQSRDIYTLEQESEITEGVVDMMGEHMHRVSVEPGKKIIAVLPQEFTVDNKHNVVDPIGMSSTRLEANFHIIYGSVTAIQNIETCIKKAGLKMAGLVLGSLASSSAVLHRDELDAGVALVDIGGGTTDVVIFKNKIIRHTATIPYAGRIITEDIMEGFGLLKPQAEKLKTSFGNAVPGETSENEIISIPGIAGKDRKEISMRTLSHMINARMEEIFSQVYFEIKSAGYANSLKAGIVVTGGGSQIKNLKQLIEYSTGLSARIGYPNFLSEENKAEVQLPDYSTVIGLILEGFEEIKLENEDEKTSNLNPEIESSDTYKHSSKQRSSQTQNWLKGE